MEGHYYSLLSILIAVVLLGGFVTARPPSPLNCIFNNKSNPYFHRKAVDPSSLSLLPDGRLSVSGCSACFTLWSPDEILGQGCWSSHEDCGSSSCNDYALKASPTMRTKLCCCTAEHCNGVIVPTVNGGSLPGSSVEGKYEESQSVLVREQGLGIWPFLIPLAISLVILCLVLLILFLRQRCYNCHHQHTPSSDMLKNNASESSKLLLPSSSSSPLPRHLSKKILPGELEVLLSEPGSSFGSYHATEKPSGRRVLLKVPLSREAYTNETRIYEALEPHPSVLRMLYHAEGFSLRGNASLDKILVFSLSAPQVPLSYYLRENTLSWSVLVNFLSSITDGLTHIHSDSSSPQLRSPHMTRGSICHRNLTSDSVLVRGDSSVVIGDFSRSVRVSGCHVLLGEDSIVQASGLSFIPGGDPRYMAPEVLEGSLNFRDAESSFKQGDVYSLGLLFWEISRRCDELYQGSAVPEFERPFDREIRGPLSLETMKVLVARYRSRPLFPSVWKDSNPAVQLLRETIEDSWDQDGDARLTAFCVKERLYELNPLWERYKKNKNADLSPGNNASAPGSTRQQQGGTAFNNLSPARGTPTTSAQVGHQIIIKNDHVFHSNDFSSNSTHVVGASSINSSSAAFRCKNDNVLSNQMPSLRLQPYQGLNPCKERNLKQPKAAACSMDEEVEGLLINSSKDFSSRASEERSSDAVVGTSALGSVLPATYVPAAPIPYTQNQLEEGEESPPVPPTTHHLISKENNVDKQRSHSRRGIWHRSPSSSLTTSSSKSSKDVVVIDPSNHRHHHHAKEKQCNLDIEKSLLLLLNGQTNSP